MTYTSDSLDWTPAHDLALIYLALTHGADTELDANEVSMMQQKLRQWLPKTGTHQIKQVMNQVMLVYLGGSRTQMLDTSVAALRETMPKGQRIAVLNDLADIASADGMIVPGEVGFIQHLATQWELDGDLN
jgi:uncharacterized tellurite resistance protein B-like protein